MPLWNGLWALWPNRKKAKSIKVSLPKLWISAHLFVSWERLRVWSTFPKSKMNESLRFPTSIKKAIPCGLNASARITGARLNSRPRELIRKPAKTWRNNRLLTKIKKVWISKPFFYLTSERSGIIKRVNFNYCLNLFL